MLGGIVILLGLNSSGTNLIFNAEVLFDGVNGFGSGMNNGTHIILKRSNDIVMNSVNKGCVVLA